MNRFNLTLCACVLAGLILGAFSSLFAQDLTITNARIIVGNGTVIDNGSIVIRGGKIGSAAAGKPATTAGQVIDAKGMSAMPGYIDAHKHINNFKADQMQDLLEAGYTTILSGGGSAESVATLRDQIESGAMNGPRLIVSGPVNVRMGADIARQQVDDLAAKGVKWTGEIGLTPEPGPSATEIEGLKAAVDEGARKGVTIQVHAVSVPAMMGAIDAGARHLVHVPNKGWVTVADAQKLTATGTHILGTIGFGAPVFGVFADDNKPRFRDGKPWPASISGAGILDGVAVGQEIGYTIVNSRTIWDAGGILGYCTDDGYEARVGLEHELRTYNVMFSMKDIVKLMGPNTADYLGMSDQIGTLEPGKLADVVLQEGNPMEGYWNWLNVKVVVKGGKVAVDKR